MLVKTSKPAARPALLVLEDGTAFAGTACGAVGEAFGEICFNTTLEGYLEVVTDPSYAGQIVAMTYPQSGNYGVNLDDAQAERPALRGLVVRDMCYTPSSWRSEMSLPSYLAREGVVAIEGVDTRALTLHLREHGNRKAFLCVSASLREEDAMARAREWIGLDGQDYAAKVTCEKPYEFKTGLTGLTGLSGVTPERSKVAAIAYTVSAWALLISFCRCSYC
jgi:carbamoyl-phosphate synthase small subunit